jgi:hypothetical protein
MQRSTMCNSSGSLWSAFCTTFSIHQHVSIRQHTPEHVSILRRWSACCRKSSRHMSGYVCRRMLTCDSIESQRQCMRVYVRTYETHALNARASRSKKYSGRACSNIPEHLRARALCPLSLSLSLSRGSASEARSRCLFKAICGTCS